ncbi:MAG TPA: hypothetical protein VGJ68_00440, partial [Bradyrhizobium sp.]
DRRQDRKRSKNQEHDPPRRVTDPRHPFKHRSLAHGLAAVVWSPTVSTVSLAARSDRVPDLLHRRDLNLATTDAASTYGGAAMPSLHRDATAMRPGCNAVATA